MPTISMFYGLIIRMYYFNNQKHTSPHIHVYYQNHHLVVEIPNGRVLEGELPKSKQKLLDAWVELHKEELMANWELAINGDSIFKISPLR